MTLEHADFVTFADRWWTLVLRGIAAVLFGALAFANPRMSLTLLVLLWGSYALADGLFSLLLALHRARDRAAWGWLVFEGVVSVAAGAIAFFWPGVTAMFLLVVIASRALLGGVAQIVMAGALRRHIRGEWLLAASGVLSIAFAVLVLLYPGEGALAVLWFIGAYAIVVGVHLAGLGLRLERWRRVTRRSIPPGAVPTHT